MLDVLFRVGSLVRIATGGSNCVRSDGDAWVGEFVEGGRSELESV